MYFVYALYNKQFDKIYIGQTKDLTERLKLHNEKKFKNSFTARFEGEWILIYNEQTENRQQALVREKQLKSFWGRESVRKNIP